MTNRVINYVAFTVLSLLWLGFSAAMALNGGILETAWQYFIHWPLIGQILVTLLTLPLVLGLWIWQTSWPLLVRVVLVAGLAWVTIYTFWPGKAQKSSMKPAPGLR